MNKIAIIVVIVIAITSLIYFTKDKKTTPEGNAAGEKITLYKSPSCGCCVKHAAVLRRHGFEVDVQNTKDMDSVKKTHNIPPNMESCHTAIIDGYFVEGHVPMTAIDQLLEEKPALDGIALPGMPAGSPGMPGVKQGPFQIFSLTDGQTANYLSI